MNMFLSYFAPLYGFLEIEYDMFDNQVLCIRAFKRLTKYYTYQQNNINKFYLDVSKRRIADKNGGPDYLIEDFIIAWGGPSTQGTYAVGNSDWGEFQPVQNNFTIEVKPKCDCGGRKTYNESEIGPHFRVNHSAWCELVKSHRVE